MDQPADQNQEIGGHRRRDGKTVNQHRAAL
jgi:hypothetical protein